MGTLIVWMVSVSSSSRFESLFAHNDTHGLKAKNSESGIHSVRRLEPCVHGLCGGGVKITIT